MQFHKLLSAFSKRHFLHDTHICTITEIFQSISRIVSNKMLKLVGTKEDEKKVIFTGTMSRTERQSVGKQCRIEK